MKYNIEPLSENNLFLIEALYRSVYGKRIDIGKVKEKYFSKHLKKKGFGHFALQGNKVAGFVGVIPCTVIYNGHEELSGQFVDAMIQPENRNFVLFKNLLECNYKASVQNGCRFVWVITNRNSEVLFTKRYNWTLVSQLNGYKIPVCNKYIAYLKRKTMNNEKRKTTPGVIFTEPYSFSSFSEDKFVKVLRNEHYLEYKTTPGDYFIRQDTYKAWLRQRGALYIGDLEMTVTDDLHQIIDVIKPIARKSGCSEIIFQTSPGSYTDLQFQKQYKYFPSWKMGIVNFSSAFPLDQLRFTWADFDTF